MEVGGSKSVVFCGRLRTKFFCVLIVLRRFARLRICASHSRAVLSHEAVTTRCPSDLNSAE